MVPHNDIEAAAQALRDGQLVGQFDKQACPTVQDLNRAYVELIEKELAEAAK